MSRILNPNNGGGGDKNFVFTQSVPAAVWVINHPLDKHPSVTIEDSSHRQVFGDVVYNSVAQITVTFSAAFSGTAVLN